MLELATRERQNLELLKTRFGEPALQTAGAAVMLSDLRRLWNLVQGKRVESQTQMELSQVAEPALTQVEVPATQVELPPQVELPAATQVENVELVDEQEDDDMMVVMDQQPQAQEVGDLYTPVDAPRTQSIVTPTNAEAEGMKDDEVVLVDGGDDDPDVSSFHCPLALAATHATILSHHFWPVEQLAAEEEVEFRLPQPMQAALDKYSRRYGGVRSTRKLNWRKAMGLVKIEIQLGGGGEGEEGEEEPPREFDVTPLQAAVVHRFSEQSEEPPDSGAEEREAPKILMKENWTVAELVVALEIETHSTSAGAGSSSATERVRQALRFWVTKGVLRKEQGQGPPPREESYVLNGKFHDVGEEDEEVVDGDVLPKNMMMHKASTSEDLDAEYFRSLEACEIKTEVVVAPAASEAVKGHQAVQQVDSLAEQDAETEQQMQNFVRTMLKNYQRLSLTRIHGFLNLFLMNNRQKSQSSQSLQAKMSESALAEWLAGLPFLDFDGSQYKLL
eukprot:g3655.t1